MENGGRRRERGEWIVDLGGRENGTWKTEHREWNEKKGE